MRDDGISRTEEVQKIQKNGFLEAIVFVGICIGLPYVIGFLIRILGLFIEFSGIKTLRSHLKKYMGQIVFAIYFLWLYGVIIYIGFYIVTAKSELSSDFLFSLSIIFLLIGRTAVVGLLTIFKILGKISFFIALTRNVKAFMMKNSGVVFAGYLLVLLSATLASIKYLLDKLLKNQISLEAFFGLEYIPTVSTMDALSVILFVIGLSLFIIFPIKLQETQPLPPIVLYTRTGNAKIQQNKTRRYIMDDIQKPIHRETGNNQNLKDDHQ